VKAVQVENLTKAYGPFAAVQGVSFRIEPGETVALLGANGAGKSTLMKLIVGLLAPTAGRVVVGAHDISEARREAARLIGFLPEDCPLYPDMTPAESLRFLGVAREMPAALLKARIGDVAAMCDISDILHAPIGTLSRGLRQRVGLAQALLHDPDCLLLDEPSAGLDPLQSRRLRSLWTALDGRKTMIISTHLTPEVEHLAARVLVMGDGRLLFDGTVAQLRGDCTIEDAFCRLAGASREE
jgi:ABC-2 type transport system ATP-binding protein